MANPYTERLNALDNTRVQKNARQLGDMVGLPLHRPGSDGQMTSPSGVPVSKPQVPNQDEDNSYKNSTFWGNFDYHRQNDPHFDSFSGELTKLATGLRKQVEAGYMPQQIAQDRVHQFVLDTFHSRNVANPHIERQKQQEQTQQQAGQMLQLIAQQATQNPTADSQMAQLAPTPAIQNLSDQGGQ